MIVCHIFFCFNQTPTELRAELPNTDVVAFQCRNPIHRAHYELFIRALDADNVAKDAHVLVHPTCGPTQEDDIPAIVRRANSQTTLVIRFKEERRAIFF